MSNLKKWNCSSDEGCSRKEHRNCQEGILSMKIQTKRERDIEDIILQSEWQYR